MEIENYSFIQYLQQMQFSTKSEINTNILRLQMEGSCNQYELLYDREVLEEDIIELQKHIQSSNVEYIYAHPHLYSINEVSFQKFTYTFSRGVTIHFEVKFLQKNNKIMFLESICGKLLRSLNFLNCPQINACFNPFQEYKNNMGERIIPGLSIEPLITRHWESISLIPLNMILHDPKDISNTKMLLDYSCGTFYEKANIVRVDKTKMEIHFRNGKIIDMANLKAVKLKNMVGFELANKINNSLTRLKEEGKQILSKWGINFEGRFYQIENRMVSPGTIELRNRIEKPISDIITPMARNTYNHYFRNFFKQVCFEDTLENEIFMFSPVKIGNFGSALKHQFQNLNLKMNLKVRYNLICFQTLQKYEDIDKMLQKQIKHLSHIQMFVIPSDLTKPERDTVNQLKQFFIYKGVHFHFVQVNPQQDKEQMDIVALRHLSIIFAKSRINPWKIKNMPFGDKPTMICNLNVQKRSDNQFSICIVSTLNSYFSKFSCFHALAKDINEIEQNIFFILRQSVDKFRNTHNSFPLRVFVFRTGFVPTFSNEFNSIRNRLTNYYRQLNNLKMNILTYLRFNKSHPIRSYKQIDDHIITHQTIKKSQLLSVLELNNKSYLQLEFDQPMTEVEVLEKQNDPSFMSKIQLLIVKLCFGSVGNQFGKGRGFFDFASKFNEYRDFQIEGWKNLLSEGYLMFL